MTIKLNQCQIKRLNWNWSLTVRSEQTIHTITIHYNVCDASETIPYVYLNYGFAFNYPYKLNNNVKSLLERYVHVAQHTLCHIRHKRNRLQKHKKEHITILAKTQFKAYISFISILKAFAMYKKWFGKKSKPKWAAAITCVMWKRGVNSFESRMKTPKMNHCTHLIRCVAPASHV